MALHPSRDVVEPSTLICLMIYIMQAGVWITGSPVLAIVETREGVREQYQVVHHIRFGSEDP